MSSRNSGDTAGAGRRGARFATGRLLAGRYEIRHPLGEGGTAEVFLAVDHRLDRQVAVKVLRPEFGQDANARARFAVEARSAAALNVPNIVPVYDFGAADDGSLFIVMRYIDGPSLRRMLAADGTLPVAAALDVGRQVSDALAAAHVHGLIHRDVKPGNILVDQTGMAHLTDFGTVKALSGSDDLTRSGTIFGTAAYLSPEQATGGQIGPYTDIYAIGVVLYEALSGHPPFRGDDPVAVSYRHAHEIPRPLLEVTPGLEREINDVVMACLAKAPDQRPVDAARLASMLDMAGRRLAPRGGGRRLLGQLATNAGAGAGAAVSMRHLPEVEPDKETVALPHAPAAVPLAAVPLAAVPPAAFAPGLPALPAAPVPTQQRMSSWEPAAIERGVTMERGVSRQPARSRTGALGAALLVALLLVLVGASIFIFTSLLRPSAEDPGFAAVPSPTATVLRPRRTDPPVITLPPLPTATPTPLPLTPPPPTAPPITPAPATEPPPPTPVPTPVPLPPVPTPVPPPPATPVPPPPATPVPPPAGPGSASQRVPDSAFSGDFNGDGTYHGRSASWIYGQGTAFNTMSASFALDPAPIPDGRARLELVGLDGENPTKNRIRIVLNGTTVYEGPNPLPDDVCCGSSGAGNWGSAVFEFPADLLGPQNTLSITNLSPNDCTSCPKFVMIDYAVVTYPTAR